jgi:hypothetical protein
MVIGGALVCVSLLGKSSIKLYRVVKTGQAFTQSSGQLGRYYLGGFEKTMSRREAALILGVRYEKETDYNCFI